ncbi:MAG TPA: hypothetical protein VNT26_13995 [Candidatus Sulfotelmatobacter sp.]|nr:hypothetical protein [Candidatus Sulfotelmatobacter sp.]
MRRIPSLLLILLLGAGAAGNGRAQTNAPAHAPGGPDPRVKQVLEGAGLKYKIDPQTADFQLLIPLKEGRSQTVIINSQTARVGTVEIRRVWSPAYTASAPLSAELANNLLRDSFLKKLGSWALLDSGKLHTLCFLAELSPTADRATLLTTVVMVAGVADQKEKEITRKDLL